METLIISAVSSAVAVQIIISGFRNNNENIHKYTALVLTVSIVIVELVSYITNKNLLVVRLAIEIVVLYHAIKKMLHVLLYVMLSEAIIICFVFLVGPIIYFFPELMDKSAYKLVMSIMVLAMSCVVRYGLIRIKQYIPLVSIRVKVVVIILTCTTLIPISLLYSNINSQGQMLIITTSVLLYTMLSFLLTLYICSMIKKNQILIYEKESSEKLKEIIQLNHGRLTHHIMPTMRLLRQGIDEGDINTVRNLYTKYVEPIYKKQMRASELAILDLIKMRSIHACLYSAMLRTDQLTLNINGTIEISEDVILENDLYLVISVYLNNAIEHIGGHPDGKITVIFLQEMTSCIIQIENTYYGAEEIKLSANETHHMGFGLVSAKDILDKNRLIHHTYIQHGLYIQVIEI